MNNRHSMPFGAELMSGGVTRFRLWAPGARQVDLCLDNLAVPMGALPNGWFEAVEPAPAGSLYRFRIDGAQLVPDPASRFNPGDIHGPSEVIDPLAFPWQDAHWRGRPWEDAVIYELHVGAFSPRGDYRGVAEHLDHLVELGVTALELMPLADFPGRRNWGYDGVLPFAPDASYGRPEDLKKLVQEAHARNLMVLLDVVYNHFGPEGNYLHLYAPQFFTDRHHTPWGSAIDFDGPDARTVRDFFIHNALYWLEEYRLDGLRLDAVHAIHDESAQHILHELARAVDDGPGRHRHIHLVLENDHNEARRLHPLGPYRAQWDDDLHHLFHVLATGERDGYYVDYAENSAALLARALAEGYAYQGEPSRFRDGQTRGEPSAGLPPTAFVSFLQNHDQVGNRALGDRLGRIAPREAVRAVSAVLLLAPQPPLLFMGEEWGCVQPFLFFCDFGPELARAVTEGRRGEFAAFEQFASPEARESIPDPNAEETFRSCVLDWDAPRAPAHAEWLDHYRDLLRLRRHILVPRLAGTRPLDHRALGERGVSVRWRLGDDTVYQLLANLGSTSIALPTAPAGRLLYASAPGLARRLDEKRLPPWSVAWFLGSPR